MMYLEFTLSQKLEDFMAAHVNAFRYFGGVPQIINYDNLKTVVLSRVGADIRFHPRFMDFAGYYLIKPVPCGIRKANEKGKVESGIKYVRSAFLAGRVISSHAQAQAEAASVQDNGTLLGISIGVGITTGARSSSDASGAASGTSGSNGSGAGMSSETSVQYESGASAQGGVDSETEARTLVKEKLGLEGNEVMTVEQGGATYYVVSGTDTKAESGFTTTKDFGAWVDSETGMVTSVDMSTHVASESGDAQGESHTSVSSSGSGGASAESSTSASSSGGLRIRI